MLVAAAVGWALWSSGDRSDSTPSTETASTGEEAILAAYTGRLSGVDVESSGRVERVLPDDLQGSRHQRFVLRLASGHTLLLSHNIDLAPRVPLDEGDTVTFRGRYEWNERGGVVHWTHHDPQDREAGGFVRLDDRVYR